MKTLSLACALLLFIGCATEDASEPDRGTAPAAQSTPDPGGVCTKHECGAAQPGDCTLDKCADYQTACAYGRMVHVRCVPDRFAGVGSAPADQCVLIGDCSNERLPKPGTGADCDPEKCGPAPTSCVAGAPKDMGCVETSGGSCTWSYHCE